MFEPGHQTQRHRTRLVEANLSLVRAAARMLRGKGVPFSDLVQEGALALIALVEKFEPTSELEFKKHAESEIRRRLYDVVEANDDPETKAGGLLVNVLAPDPNLEGLEAEKIEKTHVLLA